MTLLFNLLALWVVKIFCPDPPPTVSGSHDDGFFLIDHFDRTGPGSKSDKGDMEFHTIPEDFDFPEGGEF